MADNKDKKVLNVPALRFPEFTDEWQHILNKELFNPVSDKNKDKIITLILSASQTEGMIERNNIGIDIKFDENSVKNYKIVRTGDYVVHLRSFQGGFAFSELTGICSPAYTILRPNKQLQYGFLRAYFMSKKFIDSLRLVTYGIRDGKSISVEEWMQLYTNIPSDKEQDKIIKLFNILDERIKLQNKIIEKLETLIKGIRNNIMSKIKGDCITLQDIADIYQPQTIASTDLTEDGYLVYGANGIIGKYHSFNHEKEQICITCRGNTCGTVNFTEPKSWITGNAMVINTDNYAKNVNKRYLFHYLSSINFNSIISGSGQPQIVRQPLAKLKLILPVLIIQNRIAECLDAMFAKMKNEQSFLQILQIQKSCLLSQMFI